jgi:hypothetical protein
LEHGRQTERKGLLESACGFEGALERFCIEAAQRECGDRSAWRIGELRDDSRKRDRCFARVFRETCCIGELEENVCIGSAIDLSGKTLIFQDFECASVIALSDQTAPIGGGYRSIIAVLVA